MENQDATLQDDLVPAVRANWLFERLPPWVVDTLTTDQKEAIHQTVNGQAWQKPPVNIRVRFAIPFTNRSYYFTLVGGEDQRSLERNASERHHYPLRTMANVFFVLGLVTLFYVVVLLGMVLQSALVEF
jgi:hypothetical protein